MILIDRNVVPHENCIMKIMEHYEDIMRMSLARSSEIFIDFSAFISKLAVCRSPLVLLPLIYFVVITLFFHTFRCVTLFWFVLVIGCSVHNMRKSLITALCMLEGCGAVITSGTKLFIGGKSPVVTTRYGQFQGRGDILTRTSNYLGIPYASAPRFDHSIVASTPFSEIFDASEYGASCPQHEFTSILAPSDLDIGSLAGYVEAAFSPILSQSEECLFINIQRPLNISSDAKLPVLLWIHGGGFEAGAGMAFAGETSAVPGVFYQGANLVKRSQDMGRPIIVASINYRLMSFGFSASQEMADAGLLNLGKHFDLLFSFP